MNLIIITSPSNLHPTVDSVDVDGRTQFPFSHSNPVPNWQPRDKHKLQMSKIFKSIAIIISYFRLYISSLWQESGAFRISEKIIPNVQLWSRVGNPSEIFRSRNRIFLGHCSGVLVNDDEILSRYFIDMKNRFMPCCQIQQPYFETNH